MDIFDITIIGSGPSAMFTLLYLKHKYPYLKICIISNNFNKFHCTYGVFMDQIDNTWIYDFIDKNKLFKSVLDLQVSCPYYTNKPFNKTQLFNTNLKYGLVNNTYIHSYFMELIKQFNITHITSHVDTIQKCNNLYNVYFKNRFIKSKFVIEGTGDNTHIGIHQIYTKTYYHYRYTYRLV
jgi:hypothetical protein